MISICIITRDEQENLEECLKRCTAHDLEVVVVDTGSKDQSIEIARRYTDHVYEYAWKDDFAAARNFAAGKASNDRIVVLDSDEWMIQGDFGAIEAQMEAFPHQVGRLQIRSSFENRGNQLISQDWIRRIYDRRYFHFEGSIHEQIVAIDGAEYSVWKANLIIDHMGYAQTAEQKKKKTERNVALLLHELQEHPEDTYLYYQIGKSYYYIEAYEKAADYFSQALDTVWNPKAEYTIDLFTSLGYALVNCGCKESALELEGLWQQYDFSADYACMMGYVYMQNARFEAALDAYQKATTCGPGSVTGNNSFLAYYNRGVILECMGRIEESLEEYRKCDGYAPAQARIDGIRENMK